MSYRRIANLVMLSALCSLSFLAACDDDNDSTNPNNNNAMIRVVNASSTTSGLNATAGTTSLATGLNFQNTNMAASCVSIPAGTQSLNFTSGSSTNSVGSVNNYNFQAGQAYTVVYYGNNNAVVYPETYTAPGSGNYAVRFINASANAGNIFVSAPGASLASNATPNVSGLASNSVSGFNSTSAAGGTFTSYTTGNNFVRMFGTTANPSTATPTGSYTLGSMSTTGAQTVIFTPANAANSNATGFQVNSCR
jgi:Domain of unknown function (DUF4397)